MMITYYTPEDSIFKVAPMVLKRLNVYVIITLLNVII